MKPTSEAPGRPDDAPASLAEGITPAELRRALRRNRALFLVMVGVTLAVTALVIFTPPQYSARAVIRMAPERRALTSGVETLPQGLERPVDPLLSAVQVLTSRTLVGAVVDSLGLRFQPVVPLTPAAPLIGTGLPTWALQDVKVVPEAPVDTLLLRFYDQEVVIRSRGGEVAGAYGEPLRLGPVGLTVADRPPVGLTLAVVRPRDEVIDEAIRRLKVSARPGTDVIDVRYVDRSPAVAQQFSNQLARLFQAANGHSAQEQAGRRREFLGEQLRVTDSLLASAEAGLSEFRSRQQMGSSRDNLTAEQASAATLEARRADLQADRRVFAALLDRLQGSADQAEAGFRALAYSPEVSADPMLGQLQQRLISYRNRLDSLTSGPWRSLESHPDVVQLTSLVQSTQGELVQAVRARVASLDARVAVLSRQIALSNRSMKRLPAKQATEAGLDRRVEVLRATAGALRQEYQKARISEALGAADIEILDLAPLPYRRAGIPRSAQLAFGLLLGLLLGTVTSVAAEAANRSVRQPEELQRMIGAAELGIIPRIQRLAGDAASRPLTNGVNGGERSISHPELLFQESGTLSLEAEAFRTLRIGLSFSWGDRPCTLVVTSAAPQEGKTLIAANLAATFARGGAHVLLVDCDIHRPRLHRLFHVNRAPGLMDLLRLDGCGLHWETARKAALNSRVAAVRRTAIDRLSFMPCGAEPQTTPELLEPATLSGLLRELRTEFDVIVLDTPPVLVSADAATLAASVDGVILVVRAGQTDRGAAELARQRVTAAGGRVFGAVLNDPDGVTTRFGKPYYAYDYPATVE